jgi:hypothetical protein
MSKENQEVVDQDVNGTEVNAPEVVTPASDAPKTAAPKTAAPKDGKKGKIEFVASPTGKFNLAYNVGETASLPIKQAAELIELGFAIEVK